MAVHDIDVNQIGTATFGSRNGLAQHGEIGGEDRGRDEEAHRLTSSEIGSPGPI